jgi:hypothetical protein
MSDYMRAVGLLKARSQAESKPNYTSAERLIEDRRRHLRADVDPQLQVRRGGPYLCIYVLILEYFIVKCRGRPAA